MKTSLGKDDAFVFNFNLRGEGGVMQGNDLNGLWEV